VPDSLAPVLNDTKWDELRLAMYGLGHQRPRFRVKEIGAAEPGPWDGEWFYHFRDGGYRSMEWVEVQLLDQAHRDNIANILASIHLPGIHTDAGFIIYGHVASGTSVDYIRPSSNKSLERTRER